MLKQKRAQVKSYQTQGEANFYKAALAEMTDNKCMTPTNWNIDLSESEYSRTVFMMQFLKKRGKTKKKEYQKITRKKF